MMEGLVVQVAFIANGRAVILFMCHAYGKGSSLLKTQNKVYKSAHYSYRFMSANLIIAN